MRYRISPLPPRPSVAVYLDDGDPEDWRTERLPEERQIVDIDPAGRVVSLPPGWELLIYTDETDGDD